MIVVNNVMVSSYFLAAVAGLMASFVIALFKLPAFARHSNHLDQTAHKKPLKVSSLFGIFFFVVIGAFFGARVFGVTGTLLVHSQEPGFWDGNSWGSLWQAGGVFYGGAIGGALMVFLCVKLFRYPVRQVFGLLSYSAFAFQLFGRLGCYGAGCCYGILLPSGKRVPVQLLESAFCAAMLVAMLILKPEQRWPKKPVLSFFLCCYSLGRFILEFFRGDQNRGVFLLSTSQWIALIFITLGVLLWVFVNKSKHKNNI